MILEKVGLWYPPSARLSVERQLTYAGISESPEAWLGKFTANSFALGIAGAILPKVFPAYMGMPSFAESLGYFLAFFALGSLLTFLMLYFEIKYRTKKIERYLPDFLELIASNLSAGISPFDAFRAAAMPEFGPLFREVVFVSAKMEGTGSFSEVFRELSDRAPSRTLRRIVTVFERGVRSGSKLSLLLKAISYEMRSSREMDEALLSTVKSNAIFLAFLLVLVAPFLLAISTQFVRTYKSLNIGAPEGTSQNMLGLSIGSNKGIRGLELDGIFVCLLATASLLTSTLMGLLLENDPVLGLKYSLPLAVGSIAVYYFSSGMMKSMLGALGG